MGKVKSLIIFSPKYQQVKTVTAAGHLVMSVIPLLLVGIVTKGKLSAIFTELSASTETVERRTKAEFFGVVLGHATEQQ
jgi:hypothetical protein